MIGERNRNREVHAHHANLYAVDEITRGVTVPREDCDTIAVFMFGGKSYRFFVVVRSDDRKHRAENFLLVDTHIRRHAVEQAAAHEISVLIALQLEPAAIDNKFGTFLHAEINIVLHLIEMRPGNERSIVGLRVAGWSDLQAFDARNEFLDEDVCSLLADGHCHGYRHATLPGCTITCTDQSIDGLIHVRVRHDDHVVLGAAEALNAFAVGAAGGINVFRDGG